MLTITTPAGDLQLLAIDEMRELAGVVGNGSDTSLQRLGLRIAADICAECNVAIGAGAPPTLKRETVTETFRGVSAEVLILSRRHEVLITSIVVDGDTLAGADYEVDSESGIVTRLDGDVPVAWAADKIVAVYQAGFTAVPGDLAHAAADLFRFTWREKGRDPSVKGERVSVPDVEDREVSYWAGSLPGMGEGAVPDFVSGQLSRFRNYVVG